MSLIWWREWLITRNICSIRRFKRWFTVKVVNSVQMPCCSDLIFSNLVGNLRCWNQPYRCDERQRIVNSTLTTRLVVESNPDQIYIWSFLILNNWSKRRSIAHSICSRWSTHVTWRKWKEVILISMFKLKSRISKLKELLKIQIKSILRP
jgi:hypothetical protein